MNATTPVPDSPPPHPARRRWWRSPLSWLIALPVLVLLLVASLAAGLVAALNTSAGTARVLSWLPRVQVLQAQGPLLGDFSARRIAIDLGGPGHPEDRVVIDDFAWQGFELARGERRGVWVDWHLRSLRVARVEAVLTPGEKSAEPPTPPRSLRLPLRLRVDELQIGEVVANALPQPVREISARLDLGGPDGASHRVDELSVKWDPLRLTGRAQIGADAPFALEARRRPRSADRGGRPGPAMVGAAAARGSARTAGGPSHAEGEGPGARRRCDARALRGPARRPPRCALRTLRPGRPRLGRPHHGAQRQGRGAARAGRGRCRACRS